MWKTGQGVSKANKTGPLHVESACKRLLLSQNAMLELSIIQQIITQQVIFDTLQMVNFTNLIRHKGGGLESLVRSTKLLYPGPVRTGMGDRIGFNSRCVKFISD